MAIVGLGMDLAELDRIARLLERNQERFTRMILTTTEQEALPSNPQARTAYVAARFAAKEAAVKALGTGFTRGVTPKCVEVRNDEFGKPHLHLTGPALELATALGVRRIHLTLTHSRHDAAAVVILEQ